MPEESGGFEQPKQELRIAEDASTKEYLGSLRLLRNFAGTDQLVNNLLDLSDATRGVARAIRAVILSDPNAEHQPGAYERTDERESTTYAEYDLDKVIGDNHLSLGIHRRSANPDEPEDISVTVKPNQPTPTDVEDTVAFLNSGYGVWLQDRPLVVSSKPGGNSWTYAFELPHGQTERQHYYPLKEPTNSVVQQNYLRILRTCVQDIVDSNPPPPTELPPDIVGQFEE